MSNTKHVLVVDDEYLNRNLLTAMLESFGYQSVCAKDGQEALARLNHDIDLVLMDVMMPGADGFEVTRQIRKGNVCEDIPVIMVTAFSNTEDRLEAVRAGANDFIAKPVNRTELKVRIKSMLELKEARDAFKQYQAELEEKVEQRTEQLRAAIKEVVHANRQAKMAYIETIHRLVLAAEYKDEETVNHNNRVSHYCGLLAKRLQLPLREAEWIKIASPLHDVGKMAIPDEILFKQSKHTAEEWGLMKRHTVLGGQILAGASSKMLHMAEIIALTHHEKWDGSGYPKGFVGETIPMVGRICAVADVFDALTTTRFYKEKLSNKEAFEIMKKERGAHFEPRLVDLFLENSEEIMIVQRKYSDE